MSREAPESADLGFRLKVGGAGLLLAALCGSLHGQIVSEAEAQRADPQRASAAIERAGYAAHPQDVYYPASGAMPVVH